MRFTSLWVVAAEWPVGLVTGSCHSLFFLLACPFISRVIAFIYDARVRGVVSMFNETAHSFFVWGSSLASVSLPDEGSHFAFLLSSAFVYIPMPCHR